MQYECGCKVHFDDNGNRIAADEFCSALDAVFDRVVMAGFSDQAWRWMEYKMSGHYKLLRQLTQTPPGRARGLRKYRSIGTEYDVCY